MLQLDMLWFVDVNGGSTFFQNRNGGGVDMGKGRGDIQERDWEKRWEGKLSNKKSQDFLKHKNKKQLTILTSLNYSSGFS